MDRFRLWLLSLLLFLSVVFLFRFSAALKMFLFAIGMAYIMMPAVNGAERVFRTCFRSKKKGKEKKEHPSGVFRGLAVLLVMAVVLLLIGVLGGICIPYLSRQIADLIDDFPAIRSGIQEWLGIINQFLQSMNLPTDLTEPLSDFLSQLDSYLVSGAVGVVSWLAQIGSKLVNLVIIFILQIYFMLDGPRMIEVCRGYLLKNRLNRIVGFFSTSTQLIARYIRTQVLISGGMAIIAFLGLKIIGLQYASLFAVLLFIMDFIPYIGSIAGTVILVLYALCTVGLRTAVIVAVFLLVLQQLEGNVLAPKVQGKLVGVHAAIIMLSLLVCFELWGPIGSLFSVLVAGMVKLLLQDVLEFLLHPEIPLREFLAGGYEPDHSDDSDTIETKDDAASEAADA